MFWEREKDSKFLGVAVLFVDSLVVHIKGTESSDWKISENKTCSCLGSMALIVTSEAQLK
jgi:hypothetical protein